MKYTIRTFDNDEEQVLFETDSKRDLDCFIEYNLEHSGFCGFYEENDRQVIVTDNYDIVIKE